MKKAIRCFAYCDRGSPSLWGYYAATSFAGRSQRSSLGFVSQGTIVLMLYFSGSWSRSYSVTRRRQSSGWAVVEPSISQTWQLSFIVTSEL